MQPLERGKASPDFYVRNNLYNFAARNGCRRDYAVSAAEKGKP